MNTTHEKMLPGISANRDYCREKFYAIRNFTSFLCEPLIAEDYCIQSMPDVSPAKWHLAHTTWFFETFILKEYQKNFTPFNPAYSYLFNSYYVQAGERFIRSMRGLLSRPSVKEIFGYRNNINIRMKDFIEKADDSVFEKAAPIIEIGINHEQQHQELILTDIKHVFSINPLFPVYREVSRQNKDKVNKMSWHSLEGGIYKTGYSGDGFCYDNELPKHKSYLYPFSISSRLVTNEEYMEFIEDKGYERPELWLSDGFAMMLNESWKAPLYWFKEGDEWWSYTLSGYRKVEKEEPVCHISFYEADAFARWKGCRLPTEEEWEAASAGASFTGNFVESRNFHPVQADNDGSVLSQMFGDVWEWTQSAYSPYPGFKTLPGALGEYNGKFMSGQMVLRGGSCATPVTHIRNTYRNFFPPHSRWQFMGIRLARNNF